uniref:Uncharacterized protein n=1 Tax=Aegilops tauschii subsp. strangulata TaxID=200361 RepID=A0A453HJ94_AEGTS
RRRGSLPPRIMTCVGLCRGSRTTDGPSAGAPPPGLWLSRPSSCRLAPMTVTVTAMPTTTKTKTTCSATARTAAAACGIRYKMGKLFPEYRPSTSPEFGSLEHSNRHRNVERIREKKMKVMVPEVPVSPDADDKVLLRVCKYER